MTIRIFWLLWIATPVGCVIDTVPLPEDTPEQAKCNGPLCFVAAGLINMDALYYADDGASVFLVGTQDAMPGEGDVEIDAPGGIDIVKSTRNGSFGASINAELFQDVRISYFEQGALVDWIAVKLLPGSVAAAENQDDLGVVLSADPPTDPGEPDAAGIDVTAAGTTVTISGAPGTADPNIVIVIANLTLLLVESGGRDPEVVATRALAAADGSFVTALDGQSGDELLLFAVEQALNNGGGTPLTVFVP